MEPAFTILLADEDPAARAFLTDNLAADGFEVWPADARAPRRSPCWRPTVRTS